MCGRDRGRRNDCHVAWTDWGTRTGTVRSAHARAEYAARARVADPDADDGAADAEDAGAHDDAEADCDTGATVDESAALPEPDGDM